MQECIERARGAVIRTRLYPGLYLVLHAPISAANAKL